MAHLMMPVGMVAVPAIHHNLLYYYYHYICRKQNYDSAALSLMASLSTAQYISLRNFLKKNKRDIVHC
jgi:hypothetical protein